MPAMPSNAETRLTRRSFVQTAAASLLALSGGAALAGVLRFLGYQPAPRPPTEFDLGPAADFPSGARRVIPEASAMVFSTPGGLAALSLLCSHLGCTVNPDSAGFTCPCHGSQFDAQGGLRRGPADRGLRSLALSTDERDHLILRTNPE